MLTDQQRRWRVRDERAALEVKRTRLMRFIRSRRFQSVPAEHRLLLARQAEAMALYSLVLGQRLALWRT